MKAALNISIHPEGRNVFTFWDSSIEDAPLVVRMCDLSWKKKLADTDWIYHQIHEKNLPDYECMLNDEDRAFLVNFRNGFVVGDPHRSWVRYTDCLRLCLLSKFGGIWADGTVACRESPLDWLPGNAETLLIPRGVGLNVEMESWFLVCLKENKVLDSWKEGYLNFCSYDGLRHASLQSNNLFQIDFWLRNLTKWHPRLTALWFNPLVIKLFRRSPYFGIYYMFSKVRRELGVLLYQMMLPFDSEGWTIFNRTTWIEPCPSNLQNRWSRMPIIKLCYKENRGISTVHEIPEGSLIDNIFNDIEPNWRELFN